MNSVRQRCQDGRLPSREALVDFCDRQERHLWILHTFVAPESQVRVQLKYSIITYLLTDLSNAKYFTGQPLSHTTRKALQANYSVDSY